jgi:hypothetical protein
VKKMGDCEIDVVDTMRITGTLSLGDPICSFGYTTGETRVGGTFDEVRGDGTFWWKFDSPYPFPSGPVPWAYDKGYLCPEDLVVGVGSIVCDGITDEATFDSIFYYDIPLEVDGFPCFEDASLEFIPDLEFPLWPDLTLTSGPFDISGAVFEYKSIGKEPSPLQIVLKFYINGVLKETIPLVIPRVMSYKVSLPIAGGPYTVNAGDILSMTITGTIPGGRDIYTSAMSVVLGANYTWAYDTVLPAGTYYSSRLM